MKTISVLFAGSITDQAFVPLAGGLPAFDRAVLASARFPDVSKILVLCSRGASHSVDPAVKRCASAIPVSVETRSAEFWTVSSFFSAIASESEGFDHVFIAWADAPFLDAGFTDRLYREKHVRYAAEYSFADGYPYGLAPEIIARGLAPILASLVKDVSSPVTRQTLFDAVKKDINSFDIETEIAPVDLRQLRLEFVCDTKRNTRLCTSFDGVTEENYADLAAKRSFDLRTLPAFYAVQVAARCPFECAYCPYPGFCASGKGRSPGKKATELDATMNRETFAGLVEKIEAFSGDAVISLSLWGECSYHPDIARLVGTVLSYPSLSVLIETTGIGWKKADLDAIAEIARNAAPRTNGQNPVNWIVSLDAVGSACYGAAHGLESAGGIAAADADIREAISFTQNISALFPKMVWPQMVRMNENEMELEAFYRFWKEKLGQVIIQKHDSFCHTIPDRRVADLSPLTRHPCWHLKRDMCILLDGAVPFCREDVYASRSCGNAITDDLAAVWDGNRGLYEQHACGIHEGMCGACDEYYTFNF
jgi:spiro-SPASM protein